MLFIFDNKTKSIKPLHSTDFKGYHILERKDIEKWIEDNPLLLGEELLIISKEYDKFSNIKERVDLLALDKVGNLVIIELKRDDSGKYADLQALRYASYCSTIRLNDVVRLYVDYNLKIGKDLSFEKAEDEILNFIENDDFEEISDKPRIILAAKEFRPEVTATVLWLRKFGVDISCIKITPYRYEDDEIILETNILIPLPEAKDYIIEVEKKEGAEKSFTLRQQEYINFYNGLIKRLKLSVNKIFLPPKGRNYYQIPTKHGTEHGIHFEWAFHGRPRSSFGVELHFETSDVNYNRTIIDRFVKFIPKIEELTGEKVIVQKEWGRYWSRIYIEKNEGRITPELEDWALKNMKIFIEILEPEIEKI